MPRKKDVLPPPVNIPLPSTALPQAQARIAVAKSGTLNTIIQIMMNGSRHPLFGKTTHPGMIRVIWNAYERKDEQGFLTSVERYLIQAIGNVPQAGKQEDMALSMQHLTDLVQEAGVEEVGIRLLRGVLSAPVL